MAQFSAWKIFKFLCVCNQVVLEIQLSKSESELSEYTHADRGERERANAREGGREGGREGFGYFHLSASKL